MMWVHILSRNGEKWEVQMMEPSKDSSQSSSHLMLSTSRCPVGSSSMSTSAFTSCAAQSCIFIFHPPEYVHTPMAASAARSLPDPASELPNPIPTMTSATSSRVTLGLHP